MRAFDDYKIQKFVTFFLFHIIFFFLSNFIETTFHRTKQKKNKKLRSLPFDHHRDFSLIPHSQPQKSPSAVSSNRYKPGNFLVPCPSNDVFSISREILSSSFPGRNENEEGKKEMRGERGEKKERNESN